MTLDTLTTTTTISQTESQHKCWTNRQIYTYASELLFFFCFFLPFNLTSKIEKSIFSSNLSFLLYCSRWWAVADISRYSNCTARSRTSSHPWFLRYLMAHVKFLFSLATWWKSVARLIFSSSLAHPSHTRVSTSNVQLSLSLPLISVSQRKGQRSSQYRRGSFSFSNDDDSQSSFPLLSVRTFGMAHRSFDALFSTLVCVGHQGHWFIFLVQWPSSFDRRQMNEQEVKEYVPAGISMSAGVCWWEKTDTSH